MQSDSDSGGEGSSRGTRKAKKIKYAQIYRPDWENLAEFKDWLTKSNKGLHYAFCKCCGKELKISSGKDSIIKHKNSKSHEDRMRTISTATTITQFLVSQGELTLEHDIKEGEIRLAAFISEHNLPFTVVDHLTPLMQTICKDSKIGKGLSCGRTKCNGIVRNVLGNTNFQVISSKLRENKFSLIVDESTDLSSTKHLCMVVRFVDNFKAEDHFFTLISLSSSDAATIYTEIVQTFQKNVIPYKNNLIGFASDGANVMMGMHHSLMSLLKIDIPSLFIMKCICHSFHLCASYACTKIPNNIEEVTRDIYNHFTSSPKRQAEFREFQTFCNVKVHKLLHPSQTRWLSVQMVVSRILEQYNALRLYFTDAVTHNDSRSAQVILENLQHPHTKLFLQFLDFILPVFNTLNKDMQSESPRIHVAYNNITTALRTIFDCFISRHYIISNSVEEIDFKNPRHWLSIETCYFGANVAATIQENQYSDAQLLFFRQRCLDFYVEACTQITDRFPLRNNIFKSLVFLDPAVVKKREIQSISIIACAFPNLVGCDILQELDTEWRMLRNLEGLQNLPDDLLSFWQEVNSITTGDGTKTFSRLCNFVSHMLCLPHSSANVERIFSQINLMKTKQRNALNTQTIIGLLHSKDYLRNNDCFKFPVADALISKMQSETIYKLFIIYFY